MQQGAYRNTVQQPTAPEPDGVSSGRPSARGPPLPSVSRASWLPPLEPPCSSAADAARLLPLPPP